ncbi:MAG: hypothetical protein AB8B81_17890 [Halioglobus sp.]
MMIQASLKTLTDAVFFIVLLLAVIFFLREVVGLIYLSQDAGLLVVRLFLIGAPLSLILSLASLVSLNLARHKWYSLVSGVEVLILAVVYWIIYASQI